MADTTDEKLGPNEKADLKITLSFGDAIAAALETPPEPDAEKPFGKRKRRSGPPGRNRLQS